jgi:SAM-dependent methyltransferase
MGDGLERTLTDDYRDAAEFYDFVTAYATRDDVAFYVDEATKAQGPVLEIGCGTGRVLIPAARAGVSMTGLDASGAMLDECRRKLRDETPEAQARVELHQGDMRSFALGKSFALATIPFRPFQHLETVDEQLACLRCIHRHLMGGGRLILDLFNPSIDLLANRPTHVEVPEGEPFAMPDGRQVARSFRIGHQDRFAQVNEVELIYDVTHPDGRTSRHVHAFRMRYLFRYEAEHLLARAGFTVEQVFADYERHPYGSTYPGDLIFMASKAG